MNSICPALSQFNSMDYQQQQYHHQVTCGVGTAAPPQKSPSKLPTYHHAFGPCFNNTNCSMNINCPTGSGNYATPTTSSVLKQRKQTPNCLSPKYRKCPLSPLLITGPKTQSNTITSTGSSSGTSITTPSSTPLTPFPYTATQLPTSSPMQQLQQNAPGKLGTPSSNNGSSVYSSSGTPLSPNNSSLSVHLVRTTKTTRLRAAALGELFFYS